MFIYKITNSKNNKVYIGQTIRPIEQRFRRHISDAMNGILDTHFARAIRKHGPECFSVECIDTATTQEELTEKERYWIDYYRSTESSLGYNETDSVFKCGGNTYRAKTSEEMNEICGRLSESKLGSKNPRAQAVKCLNIQTNVELKFDTVRECAEHFDEATHRFVTTRVNHQTRGLYKGVWAIAYESDEYVYEEHVCRHGKQLRVRNRSTGAEQIFASVRSASQGLGISRPRLYKALNAKDGAIINDLEITVID